MKTPNDKIAREIQGDLRARVAFKKLVKSGCDGDTLIKKIGNVAAAYGMAEVLLDLRKKGAEGLPGNVLPEPRTTLADLPEQLRKLAGRIEKINGSLVSPARFSRCFIGKDEVGSWVPRYPIPEEADSVFRVVAESGDRLPRLLRAYAAVVAAALRAVPKLLPKETPKQIIGDAEVDLVDYVREKTRRPHWDEVDDVLVAGLEALGKYKPANRDFSDSTTLRMRYRSASRRDRFLGGR